MQKKYIRLILLGLLVFSIPTRASMAESLSNDRGDICGVNNRLCVLKYLRDQADYITNPAWRDQTLRELAKTYAADGQIEPAVAVISEIVSNDTKAMTIRGIGMEVADLGWDKAKNDEVFAVLRAEAEKIDHPPSYAIALTYIAMSQAFAKDNEGAWATAADMENDALRHKAYAETAEIQAEHGDYDAAMKSIGFIDSEAFRNKAYAIVSKILADQGMLEQAFNAANQNTNDYKKAQGLQYILDIQKKLEKEKQQESAQDSEAQP